MSYRSRSAKCTHGRPFLRCGECRRKPERSPRSRTLRHSSTSVNTLDTDASLTASFEYKAVDAKRVNSDIAPRSRMGEQDSRGRERRVRCHHIIPRRRRWLKAMWGRNPSMTRSESPIGASRFLYTRCFARDLPNRGPRLFDPAHIARSHSRRQLLRQRPRHRNPSMLAPQSGQTRLRRAEIKRMLVFLTTIYEAIVSLPFLRRLFTAECTEP